MGCALRTITALKVQKRNPNRVNIYLDGEYVLGVTRIVAAWLRVGQTLDETQIESLRSQDGREVAYERALNYLSYRPHSTMEIQMKLRRKDFTDDEIKDVIERLRRNGLVEDEQFARTWVENRSEFRPRGRRLLALELRQKGVAPDAIQTALSLTDDDDLAYRAGCKYAKRLADLDWEKFKERLSAFLLRRGFSYETLKPVVKKIWDEIQLETGNTNHYHEEN